jgi:hypothetical protein
VHAVRPPSVARTTRTERNGRALTAP